MPLYDFVCRACGDAFEARTAPESSPPCPGCGSSSDVERRLSAFAGPFSVGLRGGAARRSDATRRAREEQRAERRAEARASRQAEGKDRKQQGK